MKTDYKVVFIGFLLCFISKNYSMEQQGNGFDGNSFEEDIMILNTTIVNLSSLLQAKSTFLDDPQQLSLLVNMIHKNDNDVAACQFLTLCKTFNPEAKDEKGVPALIKIVENNGGIKVIKKLIKRGAKPNVRALRPTRTPLIVATLLHKIAIAKYLLKKGADLSITDEKQSTPLRIAIDNVQRYAIKMMESDDETNTKIVQEFGELVSLFIKKRDTYSDRKLFDTDWAYLSTIHDNELLRGIFLKYSGLLEH